MQTLSFSPTMLFAASATAELVTFSTMSTSLWSNQLRRIDTAMSVLFWWSALRVSTLMPGLAAVNSATACARQATLVGPLISRNGPEKSVSRPMRIVAAWARERRGPLMAAAAPAASAARLVSCMRVFP